MQRSDCPPMWPLSLDRLKRSNEWWAMRQTLLHGLFPKVRAEILRLLFTNPRTELYVRELARLSRLSLQTVQDELAKLEAARLIVSRSNGYHPLLSRRFPAPALRHAAKGRCPRFVAIEAPAEGERPTPSTSALKRGLTIALRPRHRDRSLSGLLIRC
jgi:DNA-binding transcriptional MocR family regulator